VNGVNTWVKPAKFFISIALQFATVAWAISYLPETERSTRAVRWPIAIMLGWGWLELVYIVYRASLAEASHYNVSDTLGQIAYGLMGVGAVSMTAIAGYIGWRLWRHRHEGLWTEAAGLGLMAGALLGTLAGMYVSAQTGHSVGGSLTDASGTGLFGWSTTGGDLRIAHFVGLHAAQIIPFAALSGQRRAVWLVAVACAVLTVATFAQAYSGMPLFAA
jgi:hypothetical protein